MSFAQHKATEYMSVLKQKTTDEIISVRNNLVERLKTERSKQNPDQSTIQNLNWQLSLIGREFHSRKPADKKERMDAIGDQLSMEMGGSPEGKPRLMSLDALKEILKNYEKDLVTLNSTMATAKLTPEGAKDFSDKQKLLTAQIADIKIEISNRSPKAQEAAKSDINKAEGKWFGVDKDIILVGGGVAALGAAIGWGMGKGALGIGGFAVIGAGVGAGIVYLSKREKITRAVPAPNV